MLLSDHTIESNIIKTLQKGSVSSVLLVEKIMKDLGVTKQAVYKSLRKLKKNETIGEKGKLLNLNIVWIKKMAHFFESAQFAYTSESIGVFMDMEEGDSVVYRFKDFNTTDIFWGNAFYSLSQALEEQDTIYLYNPHEWFFVARPESEIELFKNIHTENKKIVLYAAGASPLDILIKQYFIQESQQYYAGGEYLFPKENYYVNVFGGYVVEVWLDLEISKEIDDFFHRHSEITPHASDELQEIINKKGKNKMKISRNKEKAEKLKRKIGKYFA